MSRTSNAQILAAIEALAARIDAVETEARRANRGVARVEQAKASKPVAAKRRAAAPRVGVDELAERRARMAAAREEAMRTGRLVRAL